MATLFLLLGLLGSSFLISYIITPVCMRIATRLNFLDLPDGKIKKHKNPTPYLGGICVYSGLLLGMFCGILLDWNILFFFIGTTTLLLLGLLDDSIVLRPYQKFLGQIVVACGLLYAGFHLKEHVFSSWMQMVFSFMWLVAVMNAFNLIDVMDGLACVVGLGVALNFLGIALSIGSNASVVLLLAFIGSVSAFLLYNGPPARIYLGDSGSLFIGGFLALIPFLLDWGTFNRFGFITPCIVLAIPLLEIVGLIGIRTYKKIPFYQGSRDHFSNYLAEKGWGVKQILRYVSLLSVVLGVSSYLFVRGALSLESIGFLGAFFVVGWVSRLR